MPKTSKSTPAARGNWLWLVRLATHPLAIAGFLAAIYFVYWQRRFLVTGDHFGEAFTYYVDQALLKPWGFVWAQTWEGFSSIMPAFFAKLYVASPLPLGYIDFYFRAVSLFFGTAFVVFIAAPFNRGLIRSDRLRIGLALIGLILINHISTFSFINIWYAAFIPVVLVSLNPDKLPTKKQVGYTIYAVIAAFTKPSSVLVPFAAYRFWKTRERVSNALIILASLWQTRLTFQTTADRTNYARDPVMNVKALYYGSGIGLLKVLRLTPNPGRILVANLSILTLFIIVWRLRGWIFSGLLAASFLFSIYANLLAPGVIPRVTPDTIFGDMFKMQRELLSNYIVLLLIGLTVSGLWTIKRFPERALRAWRVGMVVFLVLFGLRAYRPLGVSDPTVDVNFAPFRQSLSTGEPSCVPTAPTPSWGYHSNWFFQFQGGCLGFNFEKTLDLEHPGVDLSEPRHITVQGFMPTDHALRTLLIPVYSTVGGTDWLTLRDSQSGVIKTTTVTKLSPGEAYAPFNMYGYPPREQYEFDVYSTRNNLHLLNFKEAPGTAFYSYFMGVN